jgi:hypothetical protein
MAANITIESIQHPTFHDFPGTLLCSYPVNKIERSRRGQWIKKILQNHHTRFF